MHGQQCDARCRAYCQCRSEGKLPQSVDFKMSVSIACTIHWGPYKRSKAELQPGSGRPAVRQRRWQRGNVSVQFPVGKLAIGPCCTTLPIPKLHNQLRRVVDNKNSKPIKGYLYDAIRVRVREYESLGRWQCQRYWLTWNLELIIVCAGVDISPSPWGRYYYCMQTDRRMNRDVDELEDFYVFFSSLLLAVRSSSFVIRTVL